MELQTGQLITAPFLPATAEVKQFEPRRGYYRLEVLLRDGSNGYLSQNITADQLAQIRVLERNPVALTDNAEDFFFFADIRYIEIKVSAQSGAIRLSPKGKTTVERAAHRQGYLHSRQRRGSGAG